MTIESVWRRKHTSQRRPSNKTFGLFNMDLTQLSNQVSLLEMYARRLKPDCDLTSIPSYGPVDLYRILVRHVLTIASGITTSTGHSTHGAKESLRLWKICYGEMPRNTWRHNVAELCHHARRIMEQLA